MTPHSNRSDIWFINYDGTVEQENCTSYRPFRPVIVVKKDTFISEGAGTWSNPYVI